ncbi:hypothetical protein niasHS_002640 [Heterodera schachtii]|uniref:RRM domain-containing protein n=1 Tax=Heterodera schachtii TaxID=97005 RepID=A0ABD2K2M5_HETSC
MDQKETLTAEQLQKMLLDAEKSGEYSYEGLLPIWEEAKGMIENEEQMVSLYTTFIYMSRRFAEREKSSPDYSRAEELFHEGSNFLGECFDSFSDASIRFEKNFAYFCYTKIKKTDQAREIWNKLLVGEQSAFPWLEAIALERSYGDIWYARRLFFKALDAVTYRQDEIFGRFVQFEREEGTREQLDLALARVNAKATEYNTWMEQQKYSKTKQKMGRTNEMKGQKTAKKKDKKEKGKETTKRAEKKANGRQEEKRQKAHQKEEKEGEEEKEEQRENMEEERAETSQMDDNECTTATFETSSIPMGPVLPGIGQNNKKDELMEKEMEKNDEKMTLETNKIAGEKRKRPPSLSEKSFPYNAGLEKNKLFVKKLDWSCTGEELKKFFEKFGTVVDARIVTKWDGRSKGCAYVDFADEQSASAALMEADGAEIRGRKISVYLSNPPPTKRMKMEEATLDDHNLKTDKTKTMDRKTEQKQATKPSRLMPRAAFLTGAGQRIGKASRLMLPMSGISKRSGNIATEGKSESPVGVVTESTKDMSL